MLNLSGIPVAINAQTLPSESRSVDKGDMELVVCNQCTHLFNKAFDPDKSNYDASYENSLHYSEHFQKHAKDLAQQLINEYDLKGATVAEAGAGPGHFLTLLCEEGVGKAYGFDPSYNADRLGAIEHASVTLSKKLFPADGSMNVKMAISQHVMEHLTDPVELLKILGKSIVDQPGGVIYSEMPNGDLMLEHCALWDLIYEHYSYFTAHSLSVALERAGLESIKIGSFYGGQFLYSVSQLGGYESKKTSEGQTELAIETAVEFGKTALKQIVRARDELDELCKIGPVALWGAGSKGMTYLNVVADDDQISAVIDVNPRKTGYCAPGTNYEIGPPESLRAINPSTILIANPIYAAEISAQLESIGIQADVKPLWN